MADKSAWHQKEDGDEEQEEEEELDDTVNYGSLSDVSNCN